MDKDNKTDNKVYLKFYLFGTILWIVFILTYFLLISYLPDSKLFEIIGYPIVLFGIFGIPIVFIFSFFVRVGEYLINKISEK